MTRRYARELRRMDAEARDAFRRHRAAMRSALDESGTQSMTPDPGPAPAPAPAAIPAEIRPGLGHA